MTATYKTYDPNGNAVIFDTAKQMGDFLDLDFDDRRKIFAPGVHTTKGGDEVIVYAA